MIRLVNTKALLPRRHGVTEKTKYKSEHGGHEDHIGMRLKPCRYRERYARTVRLFELLRELSVFPIHFFFGFLRDSVSPW